MTPVGRHASSLTTDICLRSVRGMLPCASFTSAGGTMRFTIPVTGLAVLQDVHTRGHRAFGSACTCTAHLVSCAATFVGRRNDVLLHKGAPPGSVALPHVRDRAYTLAVATGMRTTACQFVCGRAYDSAGRGP